MSYLKYASFLLAANLLFSGCKKENSSSKSVDEDCVTTNSIGSGAIIEGQYIITYKPAISTQFRNNISKVNDDVLKRNGIATNVVQTSFAGSLGSGIVAKLTRQEAAVLKNDEAIEHIENDRIIALGTCFKVVEPRSITWNVAKVGYGDGTGKTAWIIDTGIDIDHPDLNVDAARSKSFLRDNTSADDENGHGTHVAGVIGAKNNTIGVLGIASGASLVSLRVLDKDGEGTLSSIIQALVYISNNAKRGDVVNMSVGEEESSEVFDQYVKNVAAKGIYIAIAAGNDSKPANQFSPGRTNGANIYTVSAVDSLNKFASFSNYGNDVVDYAAPGVRILSTFSEGRYARLSGTSMATPHVAGLLLLNGGVLRSSGTALNDPDGTPDPIVSK